MKTDLLTKEESNKLLIELHTSYLLIDKLNSHFKRTNFLHYREYLELLEQAQKQVVEEYKSYPQF